MYEPTDIVSSEAQLRAIHPETYVSQTGKVIDHIDPLCRIWIERSPFVSIATMDAAGRMHVAPKGDPAEFVKVLDEKTLAIPDRSIAPLTIWRRGSAVTRQTGYTKKS